MKLVVRITEMCPPPVQVAESPKVRSQWVHGVLEAWGELVCCQLLCVSDTSDLSF